MSQSYGISPEIHTSMSSAPTVHFRSPRACVQHFQITTTAERYQTSILLYLNVTTPVACLHTSIPPLHHTRSAYLDFHFLPPRLHAPSICLHTSTYPSDLQTYMSLHLQQAFIAPELQRSMTKWIHVSVPVMFLQSSMPPYLNSFTSQRNPPLDSMHSHRHACKTP